MITLQQFREQKPQYAEMDSFELAAKIYKANPTLESSGVSFEAFSQHVGVENDMIARDPVKIGDFGRAVAAGVDTVGQLLGRGMQAVGLDSAGEYVENVYKDREAEARAGQSAGYKAAMGKRFLEKDEEGNVTGAGPAFTSPTKILGTILESSAPMALGMGTGYGITTALIKKGMSSGLAGIIGGAIGEGSVAGGQSASDAYDIVMGAPLEQLASTDDYQQALTELQENNYGGSDIYKAARERVARKAAIKTGLTVAGATAVMGSPSGAAMGKVFKEGGKNRATTALRQGIHESIQEAPQSAIETYQQNKVTQQYADSTIDPMQNVAESAVEGAATGAAMGGAMGAGFHKQEAPNVTPPPYTGFKSQPRRDHLALGGYATPEGPPPIGPGPTPQQGANQAIINEQMPRDRYQYPQENISFPQQSQAEQSEMEADIIRQREAAKNVPKSPREIPENIAEQSSGGTESLFPPQSQEEQAAMEADVVGQREAAHQQKMRKKYPHLYKPNFDMPQEINGINIPALKEYVRQKSTDVEPSQRLPEPVQTQMDSKPVTETDIKAHEAATSPENERPEPTEGQIGAGNYKKGHVEIEGLKISIENPLGSKRKGKDKDGKEWETDMRHHYGYVRGTIGRDKDHLDAFVKPGAESSPKVFVVDQVDPKTGNFDEHKLLIGFNNTLEAGAAYKANYEEGWKGGAGITEMSMDDFKKWAFDGKRKVKPVSELKKVGNKKEPEFVEEYKQAAAAEIEEIKTGEKQPELPIKAPEQTEPAPIVEAKPEPKKLTKKEKALNDYREFVVKLSEDEVLQVGDLIEDEPKAPAGQILKIKKVLAAKPAKQQKFEEAVKNKNATKKPEKKIIGRNKKGQNIYEAESGHRSVEEMPGILVEQSVSINPDPQKPNRFDGPNSLYEAGKHEFLTTEELSQFNSVKSDNSVISEKDEVSVNVPDFKEMVKEAARWKGAAQKIAENIKDNKKAALKLSKQTTKGDLDAYLIKKFGISETDARSVSNHLTDKNIQPDKTVSLDDFMDEPWMQENEQTLPSKEELNQKINDFFESDKLPGLKNALEQGKMPDGRKLTDADRKVIKDEISRIERNTKKPEKTETPETPFGTLDEAKQHLIDLKNKVMEQDRVVDDRLFTKIKQVEKVIKEAEQEQQPEYGSKNKIFTKDAAEKARELLKKKLSGTQLNTGLDPEIMQAGIQLAGYHIEAGARSFAAYTKAMVTDIGEVIRPYLRSFYEGVRYYPGFDSEGMDSAENIDKNEKAGYGEDTKEVSDNENRTEQRGQSVQSLDFGRNEEVSGGRERALAEDRKDGPAEEHGGVLEKQLSEDVPDTSDSRNTDGDSIRSGVQRTGSEGEVLSGRDAVDGREDSSESGMADSGPRRERELSNYHIEDPKNLIGGTPKVRFKKNQKAIETFNKVVEENRHPTQEERDAIAAYIGWGSFGQELFQGSWDNPVYKDGWNEENDWLREHLGEKAWKSAQSSIINAHYTDPPTVNAIWDIARQLGFKGGRVLEPSMGVGNFFGLMPKDLKEKSSLTGIELDEMTADMAKMLYPQSNIQQKGYQDSKTADGFYDVIVGNWPFNADGPADRRYNRFNLSLHDYFFVKALDQVREGGFVIGITSSGTMDKKGKIARREMAKRGNLVAAFRMPSGAFKEYAGTVVVTDLLVFQKHNGSSESINHHGPWMESVPMVDETGAKVTTSDNREVFVNEYWSHHPDNVLGDMTVGHGTTQGREGMIVDRKTGYASVLSNIYNRLPKNIMTKRDQVKHIRYVSNNTDDRQNSVTVSKDGDLYVVQGEHLAKLDDVAKYTVKSEKETQNRVDQIKRLIGIRKAYGQLIDNERNASTQTEKSRKVFYGLYKKFVEKYGPVNSSYALKTLKNVDDPFAPALAALENNIGTKTKPVFKPAKIFTESTQRQKVRIDKPSISEALVLARNDDAVNLDIEKVAELSGASVEEVKKELFKKDAIFQTPTGMYEIKDVYLSGNVRQKLREAEDAQKAGADMSRNIEALKKVLPDDIPYFSIEAKLGATWIPTEVYKDFIADTMELPANLRDSITLVSTLNGWTVRFDNPNEINSRDTARTLWATSGANTTKIIKTAFTGGTITVKVYDPDLDTMVTDPAASAQANEKVDALREYFEDWVWRDVERRVAMEKQFNEVINAWAVPKYDGSFLTFEGMMLELGENEFNLRQHQVNAIWSGIANGRGLYAHEVGTGKTFTMGGIAVESRRYGLSRKPLILGHNANSADVASDIQKMYPGSKVLYVDNLSPNSINQKLYQIANDDWDAVVIPHSLIDRMVLSEETLMRLAEDEIAALEQEAIDSAQEDGFDIADILDDEDALRNIRGATTAKELVKQRNRILENIRKQAQRSSREGAIPFEDLGFDMIIIDEAHEFKKPPISTRQRVKGLNTGTSNRSIALNFLTSYIKEMNSGKGVHIFTGTPLTNTLNEIFTHMRYVMSHEMDQVGVLSWDAWFNTFASVESDIERTASGQYESVNRLSGFHNVSELRRFAGQYMDIVFAEEMPEFVPRQTKSGKDLHNKDLSDSERDELINGRVDNGPAIGRPYKKIINEVAEMSPQQMDVLEEIVERANSFKNASPKERRSIMLSGDNRNPVIVETDAAKAGFDVRLYDRTMDDHPDNKINRSVKNILDIYSSHDKACQVVFMEKGYSDTAKRSARTGDGEKTMHTVRTFNAVKDLQKKLIAGGIPENEIAVVSGNTTKKKRKEIAKKVNSAKIRVVIGQTATLGTGVNMQENLRAMHHLDAPWMPGELEQRNGRGHRQGNRWNTVLEYRYITEKIDARRWQILAKKQKTIIDFLKAKMGTRTIDGDVLDMNNSDLDDINSSFSEAAGDARILIREKLRKDVEKLEKKKRVHDHGIVEARAKIRELAERITIVKGWVAWLREAIDHYSNVVNDPYSITIDGKIYDNRKEAGPALERMFLKWKNKAGGKNAEADEQKIGEFRGFDIVIELDVKNDRANLYLERNGERIDILPAIGSIDANLRNLGKKHDKFQMEIEEKEATVKKLKQVAKEPFGQQQALKNKKDLLEQVETDLELNPEPPPTWLTQGTPIGTEVYNDGKKYEVEGHKKGESGYYVLVKDEDGNQDVFSYLDVKDENNLPIYESLEENREQAKTESTNNMGAAGTRLRSHDDARLIGKEPLFSTDDLPGQGVSMADIQKQFKGQDVFLGPDGSISVKFKNGQGVIIKRVKKISDTDYEFALRTGRIGKDGIILGKYQDQTIILSKDYSSIFTLRHEIVHLLEDLGIINKSETISLIGHAKRLKKQGKLNFKWNGNNMAENRANLLAQVLGDREASRENWLDKVVQRIVDFFDGLIHIGRASVRKLAREMESGRVYGRESNIDSKNNRGKTQLMTSEKGKGNIPTGQTSDMPDGGEKWRDTSKWDIPTFKPKAKPSSGGGIFDLFQSNMSQDEWNKQSIEDQISEFIAERINNYKPPKKTEEIEKRRDSFQLIKNDGEASPNPSSAPGKGAPQFSTSDDFTGNPDFDTDVKTWKGLLPGIKNVIANRNDKGKNYKPDLNFVETTFGLLSHNADKIPALKRFFNELIRRPEYKYQKENELSKDGNLSLVGVLEDLQRHNKQSYNELRNYLLDRDINQIGTLVKETEIGWEVRSEKKNGKRTTLIDGLQTKEEAREWAIDYEVSTYHDVEGREALKAFRDMTAKLRDYYAGTWQTVIEEYQKRGLALPQVVQKTSSGETRIDLKVALAKMGERSSYYFPRQRNSGEWKVIGTKADGTTYIDYRDNRITANILAGRLKDQGYDVQPIEKVGKLSEDIFQSIESVLAMQSTVNQALAETKLDEKLRGLEDFGLKAYWEGDTLIIQNGDAYRWSADVLNQLGGEAYSHLGPAGSSYNPNFRFKNASEDMAEIVTDALLHAKGVDQDVSFTLAKAMAEQLADILRSRGSQARMIARMDAVGKEVPVGYETDPLKAIAQAVNSAAGGYAKRELALKATKAITGRLQNWEEFQENHVDFEMLNRLEEEREALSANTEHEKKRIAKLEGQLKSLQQEHVGTQTETEKGRKKRLMNISNIHDELNRIRKWSDPDKAAKIQKQIVRLRGNMHKDYKASINKNMIDPKRQKNAYSDAISALKNVLRNEEAADRVIKTVRGMTSLWFLGGRISSAVINLTSIGTSVPASMNAYGNIDFKQIPTLITKASKAYASFASGKGTVSEADRATLNEIESRGWIAAQLNMEVINAVKSGPAQKYGRFTELMMTPFKITEEFNRAVTILAAYNGIKTSDPKMGTEEALQKAKEVSDRAHGIYGEENTPTLLRKGEGLHALSSMYIFQTYIHNYFNTMAQLVGKKKANAFIYMGLSGALFGGISSSPLIAAAMMIFKAMGADEPEEEVYRMAAEIFGEAGSDVARYGLPGLAGISLKGSLAPNLPEFDEPLDVLGPIGGMVRNWWDGSVNITRGDYLKGAEKLLPIAAGNVVKGYREATQGVTTRSGDPVFFGEEQLRGDVGTGVTRAFGFNPTKIAKPREIQWSETKLSNKYAEEKRLIYSEIVRYFEQAPQDRDQVDWNDIVLDARMFNARIKSNGIERLVPLITSETIKNRLKRSSRPTKAERLRDSQEYHDNTYKADIHEDPEAVKHEVWFSKTSSDIDKIVHDIRSYKQSGDRKKATELARENFEKIKLRKTVKAVKKELLKINKVIKFVSASKLDPEVKKKRIDALTKKRNDILRQVYKFAQKGGNNERS